jgi:hypothetical protein
MMSTCVGYANRDKNGVENSMNVAAGLQVKAPRKRAADPKVYGKSKVSNGLDMLPDVDGRCLIARRYRDIASAMVADQGGAAQLSEARLQLVRRFAAAAVIAEQMEADLANGKQIDISEHALLCSTLVRVARQIGVNRIAKDITPSLDEYLRQRQAEVDTVEAAE